MTKRYWYCLIMGFWLAAGGLFAASPTETFVPSGPLINTGGDFAAWKIQFTYATDKKQGANAVNRAPPQSFQQPNSIPSSPPREITFFRTKPLWHAVIIDTVGEKMDEWSNGGPRMFIVNDRRPILAPSNAGFATVFPDFTNGFPDMDWISLSTFSGLQNLEGRPCLLFTQNDVQVWIDSETRYPVQWQKGGEKRVYHLLPQPTQALDVPPSVARVFAGLEQDDVLRQKLLKRINLGN